MAARTALKTLSPANYARPALRTVCAASPLRAQLLARGVASSYLCALTGDIR